jgi:hypothetical protein
MTFHFDKNQWPNVLKRIRIRVGINFLIMWCFLGFGLSKPFPPAKEPVKFFSFFLGFIILTFVADRLIVKFSGARKNLESYTVELTDNLLIVKNDAKELNNIEVSDITKFEKTKTGYKIFTSGKSVYIMKYIENTDLLEEKLNEIVAKNQNNLIS